jgi:hypothetical protein
MVRRAFPLLAAALAASPAMAAQDRPITRDEPNAVDVAKTPVTDLNIDKREIPAILIEAQQRPYELDDGKRCQALIREIGQLDEVLGPDLDLPEEERSRISAGRVAKTVVGSFIPFRGLIREVSGANDHDRKVRAAIQAGLARRGFLKGVGLARGCAYPARPASQRDIARYAAAQDTADKAQGTAESGAK